MIKETLTAIEQTSQETGKAPIASESVRFYFGTDCELGKRGDPLYTIIGANGKERPVTLTDAKKNPQWDAKVSVTQVLKCAAAPGLEAWKARQILEAALTLPKLADETLDDYAKRVIEDSREQGRKAAERGTNLHAAIEKTLIRGYDLSDPYINHIRKVVDALQQYGIDVFNGKAEHSFASPLGYGGKIDWHNDEILIDFKTKDKIDDKKQLAWPEHCWQLSAYSMGLIDSAFIAKAPRQINVFIGCDDCEVRIHEHSPEDAERGWKIFKTLLDFWKLKNRFGEQA